MPIGTCDPASRGDALNVTEYAVDNGNVDVMIRWGWDGVSVMPNCNGPLVDVRLRNSSEVTYYVNLPAKKKGLRNIEIPPGSDTTYTAQQLKQVGLDTYADTAGVQPYTEPLNFTG